MFGEAFAEKSVPLVSHSVFSVVPFNIQYDEYGKIQKRF